MTQAAKPVPDSREWWQEIAQGLGIKLFDANAEIERLRAALLSSDRAVHPEEK